MRLLHHGPECAAEVQFLGSVSIYLLLTADLPMWTGALSALPSSVPVHPEGIRFTPGQADEIIAAIGAALADAELTVDELTEAIADRTGP